MFDFVLKSEESDGINKFLIREVGVIVILFRSFSKYVKENEGKLIHKIWLKLGK